MSRLQHRFSLLVLAAALGLAPAARAGAPWLRPQADYTATTVMEGPEGRLRGRVWSSGEKERRELRVNGASHTVILRRDRGVSWILMPDQQLYVEQALAGKGMGRLEDGHFEREALGREAVNGAAATKYRVHGTTADGEPFEATMWMTEEEIPVRIVSGEGGESVRMELDDLAVGKVDPARFEIPEGYRRFELPGPAKDALRERYGR